MMVSSGKVSQLRALLSSMILPLIDNDYVLLDLPYYSNPGDTLIWEGTEQLLGQSEYKCLYRTAEECFNFPEIPHNVIIFLQGGGNWGDLWSRHQSFRKKVIVSYPNNKIVILPQSIYYIDYGNWLVDVELLKRHRNLFICVRDLPSYELANKAGLNNVLLLPDMAFGIDVLRLEAYKVSSCGRDLLIKRQDSESPDYSRLNLDMVNGKIDILDWPTMMSYDAVQLNFYRIYNRRRFMTTALTNWYANKILRPHIVKSSVRFLSSYNQIYTTRLHAAILSVLIGKSVTLIDNSYGKNSNFYNAWLSDVNTISLRQ